MRTLQTGTNTALVILKHECRGTNSSRQIGHAPNAKYTPDHMLYETAYVRNCELANSGATAYVINCIHSVPYGRMSYWYRLGSGCILYNVHTKAVLDKQCWGFAVSKLEVPLCSAVRLSAHWSPEGKCSGAIIGWKRQQYWGGKRCLCAPGLWHYHYMKNVVKALANYL